MGDGLVWLRDLLRRGAVGVPEVLRGGGNGAFSGWLAVYHGAPLWGGVAVAAGTGAAGGLPSQSRVA